MSPLNITFIRDTDICIARSELDDYHWLRVRWMCESEVRTVCITFFYICGNLFSSTKVSFSKQLLIFDRSCVKQHASRRYSGIEGTKTCVWFHRSTRDVCRANLSVLISWCFIARVHFIINEVFPYITALSFRKLYNR